MRFVMLVLFPRHSLTIVLILYKTNHDSVATTVMLPQNIIKRDGAVFVKCVFQRFWHTTVRFVDGELDVETTYCGSDKELAARMIVDPDTFTVHRAWWEIYRAPGYDSPHRFEIKALEGMKAYFGCGKDLNNALEPQGISEARDLFAEGVRGVVQAETFLWQYRGFSDAKEYENYWYELFDSGCRYYSNTDRVSRSWYEHVGYSERNGALFNRFKNQALYLDQNTWLLKGHFVDSFHSVALEMELEKNSDKVLKAKGEILRAPDRVCMEAASFATNLEQKQLLDMSKKEIAQILGSENGCVHLIDLAADGANTLSLYTQQSQA